MLEEGLARSDEVQVTTDGIRRPGEVQDDEASLIAVASFMGEYPGADSVARVPKSPLPSLQSNSGSSNPLGGPLGGCPFVSLVASKIVNMKELRSSNLTTQQVYDLTTAQAYRRRSWSRYGSDVSDRPWKKVRREEDTARIQGVPGQSFEDSATFLEQAKFLKTRSKTRRRVAVSVIQRGFRLVRGDNRGAVYTDYRRKHRNQNIINDSPASYMSQNKCDLPRFWRSAPKAWFVQAECLFAAKNVTEDDKKFNLLVGALDQETAVELMDVIDPPPAENTKYKTVKDAIVHRTTDSTEKQLHVLLSELARANHASIATFVTLKKSLNLGLRRDFLCEFIIADVSLAILGADFLARHGLLPDCKNQEIIDLLTGLRAKGSLRVAPIHSVSTLETAEENTVAQQYARLVDEFSDLFEPSAGPVQIKSLPVKHNIITTGPTISERPRRLTGDRLAAAKKVFDDLLNQGIIRPSNSQWASPLHLVPKKNGSWRVTGDYRRLNAVTVPDRYPLPIIEDLLQESPGKVFSTVDLQKAFYQIPVAEQDIEKTAVTTPFGLFEFLGTITGLPNSAQTMQRTINHVLRKLPFAKAYVDDIFVASNSHAEHLTHLRQLFETLREANLKINRQKCTFGKPQVLYLGYQVSSDGFRPPPAKVKAITDFPQPTNATELHRFLGMVNYYRQCLPHAAHIQAPLHELLKGLPNKKAKLRWNETALQAFKHCKESIVDATCNTFLRPDAELALRTDASNVAIGAALEQKEPNGSWRPLGFFSRKLDPTQRKYSTYDRELLAVSASIKLFERILEGRTFTTWTDHRPLVYASQQRSDKASPRQVRSLEFISRFNTTLRHARGEDNVVADALSRTELSEDTAQNAEVCNNNETSPSHQDAQISNVEVSTISMPNVLTPSSIAEEQADDDELRNLQNSSLDLQRIVLNGFSTFGATSPTKSCAHIYQNDFVAKLSRSLFPLANGIPGDFCVPRTPITEKSTFVRKLRQIFRDIKPVPASRHSSKKPFVYNDLPSCTHVFKRIARIRKPLEPPYSGPHRIINRIDDCTYNIEVDGEAKVVLTDQLKPAYLEHQDAAVPAEQPPQNAAAPAEQLPQDAAFPAEQPLQDAAVPAEQTSKDLVSTTASRRPRQKVSFARNQNLLTGK
ncbi:unnamed protein product [Trichogramma brassicae]|uniref:RNA-directed DNA polymerase n=1 Tax=Trichogramma brassicae TaxID=86971 RepID=A0A6H5I314_9HYME|nr:unnamed protein product [Trichogramma brassicae]